MKDKKKKRSVGKHREQDIRQEKEDMCREILLHARTLADEINLRMLMETEAEEMLFVECITVTQIHFPDSRKNILKRIAAWLRQIWERFRNTLKR